jgi:hypothetical protein
MPAGYRCFTDYPILALGDKSGKRAPIRECRLLSVDGALRYCDVLVKDGNSWTQHRFKVGYLYADRGRLGSKKLRLQLYGRPGAVPIAIKIAYMYQDCMYKL